MGQRKGQSVLFEDTFSKPVRIEFDAEALSSDGGAVVLGAADRRLRLTQRMCEVLCDERDPVKVRHTLLELVRQRVYGIALGYADCNDAQRVGDDPVLKMLCDRDPIDGEALASQSTLSRFENAPRGREVVELGRGLERWVLDRQARRHRKARRVFLDFDGSDDPTHGQQAFSFFNGYYDSWCFQPQVGLVSFEGDPDQYLFHARLRPGNSSAHRGVIPVIRRAVARLRDRLPKARIVVRLDGGYANPQVLDVLDDLPVGYVVAMAKNKVLDRRASAHLAAACVLAQREGKSAKFYGETRYRAKSWRRERRVIFKAEVLLEPGFEPKENARFVVTNQRHSPKRLYDETYCGRGDPENRIKELKHDLAMGRTSCESYLANQLRVLFTVAAFALFQELRWKLRRTEAGRMQVGTLRLRLLKVAARVVVSVRRIVLHLPTSFPWAALLRRACRSVGAVPG